MTPKRDTSNAGLFDRLDSLRLEVKQDISTAVNTVAISQGRLEKKFDDLEQGRLTRLEAKMTDFEINSIRQSDVLRQNQAILSTKFIIIGTIFIAIFNAVLYGLFTRLLK